MSSTKENGHPYVMGTLFAFLGLLMPRIEGSFLDSFPDASDTFFRLGIFELAGAGLLAIGMCNFAKGAFKLRESKRLFGSSLLLTSAFLNPEAGFVGGVINSLPSGVADFIVNLPINANDAIGAAALTIGAVSFAHSVRNSR